MQTTATATENQTGLNELVREKLRRKMEHGAANVIEATQKLESEGKMLRDFIVPVNKMRFENPASGIKAHLEFPEQTHHFNFTDFSMSQIAEKFKIPAAYLKTLAHEEKWGQPLATTILNAHAENTSRERLLVREVNGEIRGVLSDYYRRMDSKVIMENFIIEATAQGAQLVDGFMDDRKLWLEMMVAEPIEVPTARNGIVQIAFGVRISNSDFGDGSLELRSFILQGICLNGLVTESALRKIHLGGKLPDNIQLSDRTYRLDTETMASAVRDITNHLLSAQNFQEKAQLIQLASENSVDLEKGIKELIKVGHVTKEEGQGIEAIMMNNNPEDGVAGEGSLWKLAQGVSAIAREAEGRRSRELQEIAGNIMLRAK